MIRKVKNRSLDQYTFPVDDYFVPPETIIDFMYSADCRGLTGWKMYGSLTIKTDIKKTTLRQLVGKQWSFDGLTYTLSYGGDGYDKCYTGNCVRIGQTNTAGRLCIPWDEKWAITDTDDYYDRPLSEWTYSPAPGHRVIYLTHTTAQSSRNSYFNAQLILNGGTVLDTIKIPESGAYPADRPDMLSLVANGRWYMGGSGYDVSKWGDPFGDYKFFYDADNYLKCYNANNPTKLYKVGKTSDISSAKTIANSYPTSSLKGDWILYNQFTKSSSVYKIYLFDEDACPLNIDVFYNNATDNTGVWCAIDKLTITGMSPSSLSWKYFNGKKVSRMTGALEKYGRYSSTTLFKWNTESYGTFVDRTEKVWSYEASSDISWHFNDTDACWTDGIENTMKYLFTNADGTKHYGAYVCFANSSSRPRQYQEAELNLPDGTTLSGWLPQTNNGDKPSLLALAFCPWPEHHELFPGYEFTIEENQTNPRFLIKNKATGKKYLLHTAESRTSATTLNYNTHRQTYLQSVLPTSTGIPQLYVSEL